MPIFNYKAKEMIVKIVYYGPGLGGKTTSLQSLHEETIAERKGDLYFLATETDQTIYFELLPLHVGEIKNFKLRFQVYTVPGQVKYNNTRKAVLQGVDAIVFVADSQRSRREANLTSFKNLIYNLRGGYNVLLQNLPLIYQYNKRDMRDLLSVTELNQDLNPWGCPYFETIATEGDGVIDAFETIATLVIQNLEDRLLQLDGKITPAAFQEFQKKIAESLNLFSRTGRREGGSSSENDQMESLENFASGEFSGLQIEPDAPIFSEKKEKDVAYGNILSLTYHNGEIIFDEGDTGNEMYFIEEGQVRIVGSYKNTQKVLVTYEKGDFFGEMVLFGGSRTRSARAVAVGATRLLPVTRDTLASQIRSRPEIAVALLETLSERIRNDTQTISKLADQNRRLVKHLEKSYTDMRGLMRQNKILQSRA
jgi:CRP-like cAMP-binding protein/signal recognition particle receptor subunit beta